MKLVTLEEWAKRRYEKPPSARTLRRWRENIVPRPVKNGRAYFVPETARYIDTADPNYLEEVARALEQTPQ